MTENFISYDDADEDTNVSLSLGNQVQNLKKRKIKES